MRLLFTILTTISSLSSLAAAVSRLSVYNNCTQNIYLWNGGLVEAENIVLRPLDYHVEDMRPSPGGVSLTITISRGGLMDGSSRTIFLYDILPRGIFYGMANFFGDPLQGHPITVLPVNPSGLGCEIIQWSQGLPPGGETRPTLCGLNTNGFHISLCGSL
ncbi:hypothetical protein TMatcc_009426 [Talaromyces marneffei ATCC 18224]|uniref:Uncharacterized protein n=1 Tax=Talaromyces marneffei PM1 TaxID=1077442 RepID=A0A093UTP4_TALMA|nr:uncharacterized protein EYB26_008676 [Talaromyces marneffei]QGA20966.1 hypothetical protein EYB26_008676 [Talaromyces marneffei]